MQVWSKVRVIGNMEKIRVLQQVLDPSGSGGVSAEYRALQRSSLLRGNYVFIPMILRTPHRGLSIRDIVFYCREIRKANPDIIHIRGAAMDGLNAEIAARICGKGKILVFVHGMYSDLIFISAVKRWISKNIIERLAFSLADGISCVCANATNRTYFDRWRSKMLPYVYNRMPVFHSLSSETIHLTRKQFGLNDHDIIGLYVGRITREKGLEVLLEAFKTMSSSWPNNLKFMIIGEGDYKTCFQADCSMISNNIFFLGERLGVDVFYQLADFFVQPSLHENHSVSLLEACSAKLPTIATAVGGNTEIIEDEHTGIIVPPGSSSSLCEAISRMLDDGFRAKLKDGLDHFDYSKFSDESIDTQLDVVYKLVLSR